MPIEEPVGITDEGRLVSCWRFTEAELADIYMANEMYMASPDARAQVEARLASLEPGTVTLQGQWE